MPWTRIREESTGVVDYHGDLQLFMISDAYATDLITYPDSIFELVEKRGLIDEL